LAGLGFLTLEKRGTDRVFPEKSAPVYKTDPFLNFSSQSFTASLDNQNLRVKNPGPPIARQISGVVATIELLP
jgi:hypothetical protein